jgi:hypothetical protein
MVYFHAKNPSLGIFWRAVKWTVLVNFISIWCFYGHLTNFMSIWNILWSIGIFLLVLVCSAKKNLATLYPNTYVEYRLVWIRTEQVL